MSKNIPKSSKSQIITIRINKNKIEIIGNISKNKKISRNKLIIQFIEFALKHSEMTDIEQNL
ncbi:MAG: hypothetical protein RUMPE_00800 [Eubacteriales bacterium SKADARSKE-1]|nr:hypothetical protein [Eubacteriales bacterium SKADARSKE-1]